MRSMRETLLECNEMHEAHVALSHVDLTSLVPLAETAGAQKHFEGRALDEADSSTLERLIHQAVALMEDFPPKSLLEIW